MIVGAIVMNEIDAPTITVVIPLLAALGMLWYAGFGRHRRG
jgi:hypothetical protein